MNLWAGPAVRRRVLGLLDTRLQAIVMEFTAKFLRRDD